MQKTPREMKLRTSYAIVLITSLLISACSSIDIFKENTEIPLSKTYSSFVIVNKELGMRGFSSQFQDELVQIQLQETLENAGMKYDPIKPEVLIRYHSNEDPRQREVVNNANPFPFWGYRVFDPWMFNPYNQGFNRVSTSNYELLQVIVDFIDPEKDKYLMTLTGVTEVQNPKSKPKQVERTLQVILNSFVSQNNQTQK